MTFDLSFIYLELEAAKSGIIPSALFEHPAFAAISFHETALKRPPLDEAAFRQHMALASQGHSGAWGLKPLFQNRDCLLQLTHRLEQQEAAVSQEIKNRMAKFTTVPPTPGLRCVLYVGTYDGGFRIGGEDTIYLNVGVLTSREQVFQSLTHECYHGRALSPEAIDQVKRVETENDYLGAVLYYTFEEGVADFIGNNGSAGSRDSVIPLRSFEEGQMDLELLLWLYHGGKVDGPEMLRRFQTTDCCYTAGAWIARCVWEKYGIHGLDLWSAHCDYRAFYQLFQTTNQGRAWPDL